MTVFEQVLAYIHAPEPARFEALALTVFCYEAEHVDVYCKYLAILGIDPRTVRSLDDIPPVSTLAYKYARIENELHPLSRASRVFLTSGTTVGRGERGRHLVPEPAIYRASAIRHLRRMMFPDNARMTMLALHPTADRMPESSLAQMISWCLEDFGNGDALCAATPESVDTEQAIEFLHTAERYNQAVCILGTTASCAALFSALRRREAVIALPPGSRLMDTGGAKGQHIPLSPIQVVAEAGALLAIQPALVINEYGMTEMCSQLYDATSFNSEFQGTPGLRMKLAPPWLRPVALDPATLKPTADGQPGLLAFFDLANAGSLSALITEDVGIVRGDAVMVLGRTAAADRRGCALAIEQFAQAVESSPQARLQRIKSPRAPVISVQAGTVQLEVPVPPPAASAIQAAASRLRLMLAAAPSSTGSETIGALFRQLSEAITGSSRWQRTIREIAVQSGYSASLLNLSLGALVRPLRVAAALALKVRPRRELLGFIMPGNVPGAGLHELVTALVAGCAAIVKTSSSEPRFFGELAAALRELDSRFGTDFGARLEVFNWAREDTSLTDALLKHCDRVVAFGDDATIVQLQELARNGRVLAFGSRFSGAAVMGEALHGSAMAQTAAALAVDCAMFDQRGCLSPHHIFVQQHAREFAVQLAAAFSTLDSRGGGSGAPRELALEDAAAIRRVRETARWRMLGGAEVELWEDRNLHWTVVFDAAASFIPSPGFCTVYVSPFSNPADLEQRLESVRGRLEGFALAAGEPGAGESSRNLQINGFSKPAELQSVREIVKGCGATYICAPGEMQSPPLDWPHGGGEYIRLFIG